MMNKKEVKLEDQAILDVIEEYFRQSALTQQVPLPRWASW